MEKEAAHYEHNNDNETTKFILSNENLKITKSNSEALLGNAYNNEKNKSANNGGGGGGRRKSTQSLLGNIPLQKLHLLVEDAKEELKEFQNDDNNANNNNNNNIILGKTKTVRTGWKRYIGIILAITSSMFFALAVLIVKALPQYHPFCVAFWRFQGVLLPSIPVALYYRVKKKEPIFNSICPLSTPGHWKTLIFLWLRGLVGASAVVLQFYSLQFISMADSSVISFSTPVFVSLASHVLLGEKSGFIPVICGIVTLFGVVVITRPPMLTGEEAFDTDTLIGSGLALACMVFAAATFLILRVLRQIHFSVITLFFGFWGSFQSLVLSATVMKFQPPEGIEHWMMAIALASLTFIGQTCITLAFKFEQAGTVSLCRTCDVLFAYVWQFVFLGVVPDAYSLVGGAIVIVGMFIIGFRKFISELPLDHPSRQTFWILLK